MMLVNLLGNLFRVFTMNTFASEILGAVVIGLGATVMMDFWSLLSRRYLSMAPPNYCFVGRWFCHMPEGKWRHQNIAKSPAKPFECALGWLAHYVIGASYGVALVALTLGDWLHHPSLWMAIGFGLATLAFPFLVMQPAFGFGFFSARAVNSQQARLKSLFAHTAFGGGLYLSAILLKTLVAAL